MKTIEKIVSSWMERRIDTEATAVKAPSFTLLGQDAIPQGGRGPAGKERNAQGRIGGIKAK